LKLETCIEANIGDRDTEPSDESCFANQFIYSTRSNQAAIPAMEVIFENQVKTLPEPDLIPMNESRPNSEQVPMATYGRPPREVVMKILGAFPTTARPSSQQGNMSKASDAQTDTSYGSLGHLAQSAGSN
jgi:hypothetical protein